MIGKRILGISALAASIAALSAGGTGVAASGSFIGGLHTITQIGSTVPANGDVNPYGIALVTHSSGRLHAGSVLVSNFNSSANLQGTGTTIVEIDPATGHLSTFALIDNDDVRDCPGGVGLTTALAVIQHRWVIVGTLPTHDGTAATAKAGCLIVLDDHGRVAGTLDGHGINGPWDLAAVDRGNTSVVFVSNVLNGTVAARGAVVNRGTVERIVLQVSNGHGPREVSRTEIGSGFGERSDPAALVIGETGLALSSSGVLYVADTLNNRLAAIPDALHRHQTAFSGADVSSGGLLNAPLGLALAPNGDILSVNANDGNIVETTPAGAQLASTTLDATGAGTLFGLTLAPHGSGVYFVDDGSNTLQLLH